MTRRRSLALLAACALGCEPLVSGPSLSGQERTFRPLGPLGAASHLTASVNLGDVDGEGSLDVVVANGRHWPEQNRIFLNDGRGGFTLARRLGDEEDGTYAAPLADFDGDGDLDLVLANRDGGANAIQWNDAGAFDRRTIYGTGSDETRGVAVGDVDGDGIPDLVVANIGEENAVYFGDSDGSFARSRPFGRDDEPELRREPRRPRSRQRPRHRRRKRGRTERRLLQSRLRGRLRVRGVPLRLRRLRHLRNRGR